MDLLYKPDWEETKQRYLAWWKHEDLGRCALAVTAPLDNPPDIPPPPKPESPEQRWYDLDWNSLNMAHTLSRAYYGGEALPVWNAGYAGVGAMPVLMGCPLHLDMATGWWDPILLDPDHIPVEALNVDTNLPAHDFVFRMLRRAVTESRGKALPSIGAFGGSGDTLAALRGTEQLLMDCIERPAEVRAAEERLMDLWFEHFDARYEIIRDAAKGSTCWFTLWSPGKFYASQNDFSYNIGPQMFRDIFLPVIRRQTEFLDHSVYHVDGINAFRHVDALCELPELQALQILPGAGKPSPLHYAETLRKVQQAGKNLHISIPPQEVESALAQLSSRGLFIGTWARTEKEAKRLLRDAERWSKAR